MKLRPIILVFLFWFTGSDANGQQRRKVDRIRFQTFEAAILIGGNFSQLDGDYFTGYDKSGWHSGLRATANLSSRASLNIEMLFSQKGSKIPHGTTVMANSKNNKLIELEYAELPFTLKYKLKSNPSSPFIELGGFYARLINTTIEETPAIQNNRGTIYEEIVPEFKSFDVGLLGGLGFNIINSFDITLRYSFALTKFYVNHDFILPRPFSFQVKEVAYLRNYHVSIFVSYKFL